MESLLHLPLWSITVQLKTSYIQICYHLEARDLFVQPYIIAFVFVLNFRNIKRRKCVPGRSFWFQRKYSGSKWKRSIPTLPHDNANSIWENQSWLRYSRATWHCDVWLCCIGSLSFSLNFHFFTTKEFHKFTTDTWCNNRAWFGIKLLVDVRSKDNTTVSKKDSNSKELQEILKELGLSNNMLVHKW